MVNLEYFLKEMEYKAHKCPGGKQTFDKPQKWMRGGLVELMDVDSGM